jgi:hypothetical protein
MSVVDPRLEAILSQPPPEPHPRVRGEKLACRFDPPSLHLLYADLKYEGKRRFRVIEVTVRSRPRCYNCFLAAEPLPPPPPPP